MLNKYNVCDKNISNTLNYLPVFILFIMYDFDMQNGNIMPTFSCNSSFPTIQECQTKISNSNVIRFMTCLPKYLRRP